MSMTIKRKLLGLWKSRTHWAGAMLGVLVGVTPQLETWLKLKLTASDYALAGMVLYGAINALRWVTTTSLEDKGK